MGSIYFETNDEKELFVNYEYPVDESSIVFFITLEKDTLIFWHKEPKLENVQIKQIFSPYFVQVKYMEYGGSLNQNLPNYLCRTGYEIYQ